MLNLTNVYFLLQFRDVRQIRVENVYGLILNLRNHWIAIQQVGNIYYNLDSNLSDPLLLGDANALKTYLNDEVQKTEQILFLVVTPEVHENRSWLPS